MKFSPHLFRLPPEDGTPAQLVPAKAGSMPSWKHEGRNLART
ncbi:MAG: hypothetical protein OXJ52_07695 [Oligoflexia bacterium]|nr:hypothetical protein [Oligoflexia bacterium]